MKKPLFIGTLLLVSSLQLFANAQSAPRGSGQTYQTSQQLRTARSEARSSAINAEQRKLTLQIQKAEVRRLQAEAEAAAIPRMQVQTGGANPVFFSMPTGGGLIPGASGETNYHINLQVGEGNVSAINTNTFSSSETISSESDNDDE